MKRNFISFMLVLCLLIGTSKTTFVEAAVIYKKTIFQHPFAADSFSSPNSPWYIGGSGWSATATPANPNAPLRSSGYLAMFNAYNLDTGISGIIGMKEPVDISEAKSVSISYYMYHSSSEDEDNDWYSEDYVVPYYSKDNQTVTQNNSFRTYRYDGTTGWKKHTCTYTLEPGMYYFGLHAVSDFGYNMYVDQLSISLEMEDKTPPAAPTITLDQQNFTRKDVSVTVIDGADTGSGVKRSEYKIGENGKWTTYKNPVKVKKNTKFFARTIDKAGLISQEALLIISNIDKTRPGAPTITLNQNKLTNKNVKVTIVAGQDVGSGVSGVEYMIGEKGEWKPYVNPITISKNTKVYAQTIDKVGLGSYDTVLEIGNIDKVSPKIVAKERKKILKNRFKSKKAVVIKITDANMGKKVVTKNGKKIAWPKKNKFKAKGKYTIKATDKVGNASKFSFRMI